MNFETYNVIRVTGVTKDAAKLLVTLKAEAVAWKKFAGSFEVGFGNYKMSHKSLISLQTKGAIGWLGAALEKFAGGIKDVIEDGNGDICLPVNMPINIFKPNTAITLYKGYE